MKPIVSGVRFLPNYMAEQLNESFDLIINTLSMSEMSNFQVARYSQLIRDKWIAKSNGLFFEQNQDNTHLKFLNAQDLLRKEFKYNLDLNPHKFGLRNGSPNIWANHPVKLIPKFPNNKPLVIRLLKTPVRSYLDIEKRS